MAADKDVTNKLVTLIGPESQDFKSTLGVVVGIGMGGEGSPKKDTGHVKKNYPVSLSWNEELKAAADFSDLELLPKLPEIWKVLTFLRRIEKSNKPKTSTSESAIEPIDLAELKGGAAA